MTKSIDQAPTLIGLTGANGAGKDTAANLLAGLLASYNKPCTVLAFATALYEEVSTAYAISTNHLTNRARKEQPMHALALTHCADLNFVQAALEHAEGDIYTPRSPRQILQWWGTEYRRAQQPSYWVQRLQARLQERLDEGFSHCVITDVRFADEAAAQRHRPHQRSDRPGICPRSHHHQPRHAGCPAPAAAANPAAHQHEKQGARHRHRVRHRHHLNKNSSIKCLMDKR